MTTYRLFLLRSLLGRMGRALAYYWVSMRAQVRVWRTSLNASLRGLLGLVGWFFVQLGPYFARVIADRREDRAELRAERRLITAQRRAESAERRARRRAELAEIKADAGKDLVAGRRHHLAVPAWISRMERAERPQRQFRVLTPRRAMLAAALTVAAVVPAYAVVSGGTSSDNRDGAVLGVSSAPGAVGTPGTGTASAPGQPTVPNAPGSATGVPNAPPVTVSGDTGEFVRTLPPLPTPSPKVPAPRFVVSSPAAPAGGVAIVGSLTHPLSEHQGREARRQAKWEAKMAKAERAADRADGK
jgi:hypothetical protein